MDRLREYRALVAIIDTGNFTAASEVIGIPRSTLSTMIANLENRLGARLFHRTTRVVAPTDEGLRLAERARGLIDDASSLETMFKLGEAYSGRVRISLPGRMAHHIVMPALPALLRGHPDLLVDLRISDERLDLVSESLDLVVRVGPLEDSSLICRRLGSLTSINCAAPSYLNRHGMPSGVEGLNNHVAVSYGQAEPGRLVTLLFGDKKIRLKTNVVVDSTEGYISAGLNGLGIIELPRFDVMPSLASGDLIEILPQHPPSSADIAILYPSRKHLPLRIKMFRDWLIELINAQVKHD